MKVLIADKLSDRTAHALRELGLTLDIQPDLTPGRLPAAIGTAHVLVVRSTKVSAETIGAASKLSLIVRAGAGVNTIDVEEMENTIFENTQAACCTLQLDSAPSPSALAQLEQNESILQVTIESR